MPQSTQKPCDSRVHTLPGAQRRHSVCIARKGPAEHAKGAQPLVSRPSNALSLRTAPIVVLSSTGEGPRNRALTLFERR
jgi:hypothetical protein